MHTKIIKNILWLLSEKGLQIGFGIAISGMLARHIGIENFGIFQYTIAMVMLFSSASFICGMEAVLPKLVNATATEKHTIVISAFVLRFCTALVGYIGFFVYYLYFSNIKLDIDYQFIAMIGGVIILREPFNIVVSTLQANTDERIAVLIRLISLTIKFALIYVFLCNHTLNLNTAAFSWFIEALLISVLLSFLYFKTINGLRFKFNLNLSILKKLLSDGSRFWIGLICMYLFLRLDRIFLLHYASLVDLGIYSAAMQINDNILTLAPIIAISFAPMMVYKVNDIILIRRNVIKLTFLMGGIGLLIASVGYFMSPYIILTIFGDKYIDSASVLQIVLFISILVFIDAGLNTFLIKYGNGIFIIKKWFLALLVSLVFNVLLTKSLKVNGVLLANVSGYVTAIAIGIYYLIFYKRLK
ncbi:oligosaccharide flippase family protein [Citrobacter freundii]|uniref:oligosaccharide flippase family protein n=1 Tax=Citrobacter freundii TaxID=546 RepID=UPI001784AC16|nr:oligosaccharide flippase family protein [Citrobacter freundii]MBD9990824.1 oligosaccharide flippase family protein [Citrobacter freundii]MBE0055585.1 oligosaccharide flippase family protein [Citrobacter freundii]